MTDAANDHETADNKLERSLGIPGALILGFGSILGTGVFVSTSLGAEVAGGGVLLAIFFAGILAMCNGLSSAQLAAAHPVSGGTYEYAHRWLTPGTGFVAGWFFLVAKSASAATAALGLASYVIHCWSWLTATTPATEAGQTVAGQVDQAGAATAPDVHWLAVVMLAWSLLAIAVGFVVGGLQRSNRVTAIMVTISLVSLLLFVIALAACSPVAPDSAVTPDSAKTTLSALLTATALMFVAYTGYGRVATLGEEVREPKITIPRAVVITLVVAMLVYLAVTYSAIRVVGAAQFANMTKSWQGPLVATSQQVSLPWLAIVIMCGAMSALFGVLITLVTGLSRVVLAMARRGDLPGGMAKINQGIPQRASWLVAAIITTLIGIGDLSITWTLSAFHVLVYYAITNACVLYTQPHERSYSTVPSWLGLVGCLLLAAWIPMWIWGYGLGLCVVGFGIRVASRRAS